MLLKTFSCYRKPFFLKALAADAGGDGVDSRLHSTYVGNGRYPELGGRLFHNRNRVAWIALVASRPDYVVRRRGLGPRACLRDRQRNRAVLRSAGRFYARHDDRGG